MRSFSRIVLPLAATLLLSGCSDGKAAADTPPMAANKLVALSDGTTMVTPEGSLARSLVDWSRRPGSGRARFHFGEDAFLAGSASFSKTGIKRATNLGLFLRGTPDIIISLPKTGEGDALENRRSHMLADFLKGRGILEDQIRQVDVQAGERATTPDLPGLDFTLERRAAEQQG